MGQEISYTQYEQADFDRFYAHLQRETELLERLISQKACSRASPVAGFEIEAWLVDDNMQPSPSNANFLDTLNNAMAFPELAKFNIELNTLPIPLQNDVFSQLHTHLDKTWKQTSQHAEALQTHLLMIGILPTLQQASLNLNNMSDLNRYRALNEQILHSRGRPIRLEITGNEHLRLEHHDVMLESATTSFQIHIQLPLDMAHHFYNAAIIASAPIVALCANAPFLFGKDLWHETRIPLFEQAIETGGYEGASQGPLKRVSFGSGYARESIIECFKENLNHFPILLPEEFHSADEEFSHLRLHNGTIWRWNRPLVGFDEDGTPHIRIEHRTPAAGPTIIDAIANAVFYYGLTKNLCDEIIKKGIPLPFAQAKDNFYQAARSGLDSTLLWTNGEKQRLQQLLLDELIPRATAGLKSLGIAHNDIDKYLDIIMQRISNKQNGCQWQRSFMQKNHNDLANMTRRYLYYQQQGKPVCEWAIE